MVARYAGDAIFSSQPFRAPYRGRYGVALPDGWGGEPGNRDT